MMNGYEKWIKEYELEMVGSCFFLFSAHNCYTFQATFGHRDLFPLPVIFVD